ncbi:MAG: hypothetical protein IJH95_06760, partial [Mogibacterium sp.]|nr:hypothetical protein [Mogibacterium sp.]
MLTVNQILVICLILVLIAFVVVVSKLVGPTLELIAKLKKLAADGQNAIDSSMERVDQAGSSV